MNQKILIRQTKVIDPNGPHHQQVVDIEILNGKINRIAKNIQITDNQDIVIKNAPYTSLGWVDCYCELREPGKEIQEDLQTLNEVAINSGFTKILGQPNTIPILEKPSDISLIVEKCQKFQTQIIPLAATSKGFNNKSLTEFFLNKEAGCAGFSQGKIPYSNMDILVRALRSAKSLDLPIVSSPLEKSLANSFINESEKNLHLGFKGQAHIAETSVIAQQIEILKYTGGHLHFTGISTSEGVELIRKAKNENINLTCDISINNLCFTEKDVASYNSLYKTNPPLRTEEDRIALIEGINDGTIDCISSYHQPVNSENKAVEIEYAEEGLLGLQTFLPMYVRHLATHISLEKFIEAITQKPHKIFGLEKSTIEQGKKSNLVGFDLDSEWLYNFESLKSKSYNHPYFEKSLRGKIKFTANKAQFFQC